MALIDDVRQICARLAGAGWASLLQRHGLDITRPNLATELGRQLGGVDRSVPGFEDFAFEGTRGVEPGSPARSLLYHALASPNVQSTQDNPLTAFPTQAELETIENFVFAAWRPSLAELTGLAAGRKLAVAVFAAEYRPGVDTVRRKHADLCFSRTGIARVGNAAAHYDDAARGFVPHKGGDDEHAIRALPVRYSVWIAVQATGDPRLFGPMRPQAGDAQRQFWVPLHKLFDGPECIQGLDLSVGLAAHHVNEKLRRIHLEFLRRGFDGGWASPDIDSPPFRFTDGIAELGAATAGSRGLLMPTVHPALVEAAVFEGQALTFNVPRSAQISSDSDFSPSLEISSQGNRVRLAPEYVHVRTRHQVTPADLNDTPDPAGTVDAGGYRARHYLDFTGDGWVEADCPELRPSIPRFIPAYSVVAAPDFFCNTDQRALMDWWEQNAPSELQDFLWETPPACLSDGRDPPNLKLNNVDFRPGDTSIPSAGFRAEDVTVTALVSLPVQAPAQDRPLVESKRSRHNGLPDGASGVFAPGWDVSLGRTGTTEHLAAYGLGSPFPEDAKLCAALSTFWPSASPDSGRSFSQIFPTVAPLTDAEIGSTGNLPWDGVPGPKFIPAQNLVEYRSFPHVDYVRSALDNKFSIKLTGGIGTRDYVARVLAMARAYRAIGVPLNGNKRLRRVLSFTEARATDADVTAAFSATNRTLGGALFRFEFFKETNAAQPADFRLRHVGVTERRKVLVGGSPFVLLEANGAWSVVNV